MRSRKHLIVKLVAGLSISDQAAVVARNGGIEKSSVPALRLHVIETSTALLDQLLTSYRADPQVIRAEVNKTRQSDAVPSDPLYSSQWALPKIGWDQVFGSAVPIGTSTVAVLDTGIDATHPDLNGNVIAGTSILNGSNGMTDPSGHGTMVAGIVAARTNTTPSDGIAGVGYSAVKLMPVTVLDAGGLGQDSDVIAGVVWAADNAADVILMAFSNPGFSESLQEAIDYAWSKNVVLVAAVGNDGLNSASFPAGDRGVIGVSAIDETDQLASFSNYGPAVFLAAPGTNIVSTELSGGHSASSGTSTSAAIVAGAAAQLMAFDPLLSNGVIVGRLARTADPAGTQAQTGNGRINFARAYADTGMDSVQPAGAAPVGNGGPFVGPYKAAGNATVSGFVKDNLGNPITLATVTCTLNCNGAPTTTSGVGGFYSLNINFPNNNSVSVNASATNFQAQTVNGVAVSNGNTATVNFTLTTTRKLAITSVNGGSNLAVYTGFLVVVQAQNAGGVATNVTANTSVQLTLKTGTGGIGGTITGTITAGTSSVTIEGVSGDTYSKAESGVVLTATRTTGNNFNPGDSASITVNKAHLTVTADPASRAYGAVNPAFTATLSGFLNGETLGTSGVTGTASCTSAATATTAAGTYGPMTAEAITCTQGTLTAANYDFTPFVKGTLTINKAHLTVTADDASRTYGGANPPFTATITDFVNGQTLATSGVTGTASCSSTATPLTAAGTYGPMTAEAITCTQGSLTAANYDFTPFVKGTLTINKAAVTATAGSGSATYDGLAKTPSACVITGAYIGDLTCTNNPVSVGPGAGTTPIVPVVSGSGLTNFDVTPVNGSYTINQAGSVTTVTCSASVTYSGAAQTSCTATVTGAGGLNQSLAVSYTNNIDAGIATASASFSGDANHTGSTDSENFTITQAGSTTVVTCPASVTYNDAAQTPCTVAVTGAALRLTPTLIYADNLNVGTASASYTYPGDANHTGSIDSKTFMITKLSVMPTISAANKVFDGTTSATITSCTVPKANMADVVACTVGAAAFSDQYPGTGKTVTATGITLTGTSAGNYQLSGTTATTLADITTTNFIIPVDVTLHIVDQKKSEICGIDSNGKGKAECKIAPNPGVVVKIFDTSLPAFQTAYGANPNKSLYDEIYEATIGLVSPTCTTDIIYGETLCFVTKTSDYLVVVKYVGEGNIKHSSSPTITLYAGMKIKAGSFQSTRTNTKFEGPLSLVNPTGALWAKDADLHIGIHLIKTINKDKDESNPRDGRCDYSDGDKSVYSGSYLEIIYPSYTVWEQGMTDFIYPFIMTGDSDWTVDICAAVPVGYQIAGVYDIDANLVASTECVQAGVAGDTKIFAFKVIDLQSPPPHLTAKLKIHHNGKDVNAQFDIEGHRKGKDKVK